MQYDVEVEGRRFEVRVEPAGRAFAVTVNGRTRTVESVRITPHVRSILITEGRTVSSHEVIVAADRNPGQFRVNVAAAALRAVVNGRHRRKAGGGASANRSGRVTAPMPGRIVRVLVGAGDRVKAGQGLVVVEAMKMENELRAGTDGTVTDVAVAAGQLVEAGALLVAVSVDGAG